MPERSRRDALVSKNVPKTIRETDLYPPVRDYLTAQGYTVRGEVRGCDVTATKDGALLIIELKRRLNLDLLVQAAQRQRTTDSVYVAVPRPAGMGSRSGWRELTHLLRRLELGLILVTLAGKRSSVEVAFHPLPYDRRKSHGKKRAILEEISGRSGDYNEGGSTRRPLLTAYRESALFIACCLEKHGPMTPRALRKLGAGPKTLSILSGNFYDWFERTERGVYALKACALPELAKYPDLVEKIRGELA